MDDTQVLVHNKAVDDRFELTVTTLNEQNRLLQSINSKLGFMMWVLILSIIISAFLR